MGVFVGLLWQKELDQSTIIYGCVNPTLSPLHYQISSFMVGVTWEGFKALTRLWSTKKKGGVLENSFQQKFYAIINGIGEEDPTLSHRCANRTSMR